MSKIPGHGPITALEPSWRVPFTGLSPGWFGKLVTVVRCGGADTATKYRPQSLPLGNRTFPIAADWHTNLTTRLLASL